MSGNCRQKKVKTRIIFVELWETSEIIVSTRVNESPGNGNWATEAVSLITSFVDMLLDLHIVKAILRFSFFLRFNYRNYNFNWRTIDDDANQVVVSTAAHCKTRPKK